MENLLYRYTDDKGIQIILGDFGGIYKLNPIKNEYMKISYNDKSNYEKIITWAIGIITLQLLGHDDVVKNLSDNIKQYPNTKVDYHEFNDIIIKTICPHTDRFTINELKESLFNKINSSQ